MNPSRARREGLNSLGDIGGRYNQGVARGLEIRQEVSGCGGGCFALKRCRDFSSGV